MIGFNSNVYDENPWSNDYEFLYNTYNGTGGYRTGDYLIPSSREMFFNERKRLVFMRNFFRPIVNAKVDPIFSETIARVPEGDKSSVEMFETFIGNCDNLGTNLHTFMRDINRETSVQDTTFIVVDNYPQEELNRMQSDNIADRIMPYVMERTAASLRDYKLDKFGNIISITFAENEVNVEGKFYPSYKQWTAEYSEVFYRKENEDTLTNFSPKVYHGLGIVPVLAFRYQKANSKTGFIPPSQMYSLAKLNWTLFNADSELRYNKRKQDFSLLVIKTENTGDVSIGANAALYVGVDGDATYEAPDSKIAEESRKYIEDVIKSAFMLAEQVGVTGAVGNTSGLAKEWDFRAHENILKTNASISKTAELWIAKVFKLYTKTTFDYNPTYKLDYSPVATSNRMNILEQYRLQEGLSSEAVEEALVDMTKSVFADNDPIKVASIVNSIRKQFEDEGFSKNISGELE